MDYYKTLEQNLVKLAAKLHSREESEICTEAARAIKTLKIFSDYQGDCVKIIHPKKTIAYVQGR